MRGNINTARKAVQETEEEIASFERACTIDGNIVMDDVDQLIASRLDQKLKRQRANLAAIERLAMRKQDPRQLTLPQAPPNEPTPPAGSTPRAGSRGRGSS